MRQDISVNKAITRGHFIVNLPVFICISGIPMLALYLYKMGLIPEWGIGAGFVLGFVIAWIVWSFMITKWRIWAFKNVRNVHELKRRAIEEKLIWNDGSMFEKTEIRTLKDKEELKEIEKKFKKKDIYKEDYSVPHITKIYYSKSLSLFMLIISIGIIGVGIYLITNNNYVLGGLMSLIGIYSFIKELRKLLNTKPQIIIDNKGIETNTTEFKSWSNIENEKVIREGYGKHAKLFLIYWYDNEKFEKVEIDQLDITRKELEKIIRTYRLRNKNYSK